MEKPALVQEGKKAPEHKHGTDSLPLKITLKAFWRMLISYWGCKDSLPAWGLLIAIVSLTGGSVYLATRFNSWYKAFWDTIQEYNLDGFKMQIVMFAILATIHVCITVYNAYLRSCLAIRWRTWLTGKTMDRWLKDRNYYKLQLLDKNTDNPDQRIADDLNLFVSSTIVLIIGTGSDIATLITFGVVLWGLSSAVDLTIMGHTLHLPDGYMFYLALTYAVLGTLFTFLLGKPLVKLNFRQQRYEADFRFSLIRVRENSESVALYQGEKQENVFLRQSFSELVANYIKLIVCTKRLGFFTLGYAQTAVLFPILIAAPLYFTKVITIGSIMQISAAFSQVQGSLSTLISNFTDWASWKAVVDRLSLFYISMEEVESVNCLEVKKDKPSFEVNGLEVQSPQGELLLADLQLSLKDGEALLIRGPSGCGKSTLIKALAGIWPYAAGDVHYKKDAQALFLSQRPYLPQGTLRIASYYPSEVPLDEKKALEIYKSLDKVSLNKLNSDEAAAIINQEQDALIKKYFSLVGLEHLIPLLDKKDNWSHILSLGEQQRIAVVRALLNKPDLLFMDEASSAMDEALEKQVYDLIRKDLTNTTVISVGHRSTLIEKHDVVLTYDRKSLRYTKEDAATALANASQANE